KKSVWKYEKEWKKMSERVGFWVDMENPYVTYHNNYIESVWWALKRIWEKDLLYKGHKIVPYCPRCGTSLSTHEVAQGYKDVTDKTVIVKFKKADTINEYFLAWTTTPWTLPSNVALTVNPNETYVKGEFEGDYYILAEALAESVFKGGLTIIERMIGKDLEGMAYVPLYDFAKPEKKAYYICCDTFVTLTDGTGIVHTAPAFGEDDAKVGRAYDLPFVQLVNEQGNFVDSVTPWQGVFVKDADPFIIEELTSRGLILQSFEYTHSYPFCWRCDTPLLYYALDTWFIKMSAMRQQLLDNNKKINWLPENIRDGRFGNFLDNVLDWGLSRSRYWGTPLPIWECACGHFHTVGSIQELHDMGLDTPAEIELHKPYIDKVHLKCPKCEGTMTRVSEVIDCWFDSGSMPFAQWHYPFENKEIFEQNFPADFISEAIDQTRGWFYTLLAISTVLFDEPAFKNVIVLGHVQDKDGQKMSKHKGNVLNPWSVLDKQGADATRWYFYTASAPWLPSRFYEDAVSEAQRKFMGTLWNTYAFYVLYANIDHFNPTQYKLAHEPLPPMDKWILSKLQSLVKLVDNSLATYKITEAGRAMQEFTEDLSNWYVRRSRERFWQSDMNQDKINVYMTLHTVLQTLCKIAAPFVPFITEEIYQNIVCSVDENAPISVHLCDFPVVQEQWIDDALEENMQTVLKIVVLGRSCRNVANIKNRQPLGKMYIKAKKALPALMTALVADELNVKSVAFTDNVKEFTTYTFKPQLRTLGKKYGKLLPQIGEFLKTLNGNEAMDVLQSGGMITFDVNGEHVALALEDVIPETAQKVGFVSEADGECAVVLDTNLTEELIQEGFVREIISKLQTMRKEAGFEVEDHILVGYKDNARIATIMHQNNAFIASEVLANDMHEHITEGYMKEWHINGEKVTLTVQKV
ncbi:MAG: isoleucine--tRNA ligase, partial [Hyphomonadaceae bacterium]|nr:isoleucine--tRNA ligase [Clostridia bacterium]